jgi:hypothetical protein
MPSARTQCPQCTDQAVVALDEILYALDADFFQCGRCGHLWHVPKGQDGPASQALLGKEKLQEAQGPLPIERVIGPATDLRRR